MNNDRRVESDRDRNNDGTESLRIYPTDTLGFSLRQLTGAAREGAKFECVESGDKLQVHI